MNSSTISGSLPQLPGRLAGHVRCGARYLRRLIVPRFHCLRGSGRCTRSRCDRHRPRRPGWQGAEGGKGGAEQRGPVHLAALLPGVGPLNAGGSIVKYPILWPWLGITAQDVAGIRLWMTANLDRMHIFVRQPAPELLTTIELYVRARIGSVYEGSA
jgi:hypothetical protein